MKTHLFLIIAIVLLTGSISAQDNKASVSLTAAIYEEEVSGNLDKAVELYLNILKKYPDDRQVAAKTLYHLGLVNEKMGKQKANDYFTRLVNTYPDQIEMVALAKARLAAMGGSVGTGGGAGGLVTRRILTDASDIGELLTADGKYISKLDRNTGDIVQFEVSSGQTSRITNKKPWHWSETERALDAQVFSRDGKQIAYNWAYSKEQIYQLRIRNLDGSGLRTLYSVKDSYVRPLDWSPDARSILAFRYHDKRDELVLISTLDSSLHILRTITSAWFSYQLASFSPDGQFIVFSSVGKGSPPQGDIFLMNADGRNERIVAGHPAEDQPIRWTPDGKSILFLSDRSGTWDMWAVRITGGKQTGEPELLKKEFGSDVWGVLGFAPGGSLYYKTYTSSGGLYSGAIDLETGKVLESPVLVITRYTGLPSQLTWSPDGKNLLYLSERGSFGLANNTLIIRSAETGVEHLLSPRLGWVNQIFWVPDGRSVLAKGFSVTETGNFKINIETSEITKLPWDGMIPKLSPDGKTMVFLIVGPIIKKRNLDTGEESVVAKAGNMHYDLSPDGREVVFQVNGAVKTVPLNGGEPRDLFRDSTASHYGLEWTRDGRNIIVQIFGTVGNEIWRVPAQGGKPLKLNLSIPNMGDFTLNPDNRRFAFATYEGTRKELWVLENFLPK